MCEFVDDIETPIIEFSEEIFAAFSPQPRSISQKKRRSLLGDAVRIRTPMKSSKILPPCSPNPGNKENLFEFNTKCQSPGISRRPPTTPSTLVTLSAKKAMVTTPQRKLSCLGLASSALEKERISDASVDCTLEEEQQRAWKVSDFTLGKPLGRGKFGNVYYAKQKRTNVPIALKVLFKAQMNNEQINKMLKREIEIQYRLKHKNINQMYSYFHDQKNVYLILEYAEQGEFYKYLSKNREMITEEHCKQFLFQMTQAIDYMHSRNVYHRDIKPENILMGQKDKLLLADFGSAVHAPPPLHSTRFTVCGTPEYLSPEMILASGHDGSLDMWALGILMYEILYGRTPFAPSQTEQEMSAGTTGFDTNALNNDEIQNIHRQKMYERIITYKDQLTFERRTQRSMSSSAEGVNDAWKEPSEEAKSVMHQLIKYNRAERLTSRQLLQLAWLRAEDF